MCNLAKAKYKRDKRPIKVCKDNIEQPFMYDTGAQQSCMSFKAFKWIYGTAHPKNLSLKNLLIKDAGRKVMHNLVIIETMQDKILGINFIRQHTLNDNSLSNKCFWETPPIAKKQWSCRSSCQTDEETHQYKSHNKWKIG
jgi:hypothetical protein